MNRAATPPLHRHMLHAINSRSIRTKSHLPSAFGKFHCIFPSDSFIGNSTKQFNNATRQTCHFIELTSIQNHARVNKMHKSPGIALKIAKWWNYNNFILSAILSLSLSLRLSCQSQSPNILLVKILNLCFIINNYLLSEWEWAPDKSNLFETMHKLCTIRWIESIWMKFNIII